MAAITARLRQTTAFTSEAAIRQHRVLVDRPTDKGGTDQGPMGGELFLASIGGCFLSNLLAAARAREGGAPVSGVQVDVAGTLEQNPARFVSVELTVTGECADPAYFEKLVEIAERGCIMVNTLRGKLDLQLRIGAASSV